MASSSSSSNKYDVFLSFRGEDTRNSFTSHLYKALCQNQIETFMDNQLIRGDEIPPSLFNAIKQSEIAVVILSEGYASSRWCLTELVKILKRKNKQGQIVMPVFYGVDPSDVRNQTGNFGDAFSKLEERFRERVEELQKWRNALRVVANVSGFDSRAIRPESALVQQIVNDILKRLSHMFTTEPKQDLVGIESRIEEIRSLISYNFNDVHILGIWGIGGIGKTTIASTIFNKFSHYFDGSCFLKNIREKYEEKGGFALLESEFLSTLVGNRNSNNYIFDFNFARKRISRKRVLIVFDDVTDFKQIESLIENRFGNGSLIFITTRDKQILQNCGAKIAYEMKELEYDNALKLFSRHAFKGDQPNVGYENLSFTIIKYCHGIPLALKILGRSLFGKSEGVWKSSIEKLKRIPPNEIQNVLKISYDRLDDIEKNIFLDIACFLKGQDKTFAIKFLDACSYYAERGLSNLEDKCLIKLSEFNEIIMHDLLQQMGWEIVREESKNNYGKRSRLWHHEEIHEVLKDNTGTEAIQAISLDMSKVKEIKFLHRCNFENSGYIFRKLRFLHWEGYPLKELPQNIRAENLVFLELPYSKVEQLWNGVQDLDNLKEIDLRCSKHLTKLPDLSKAQNLETAVLRDCKSLNNLCIGSKSLRKLSLWGCSNLKRISEISSYNLQWLDLRETAIEELPSVIDQSSLVDLNLGDCSRLKNLPSCFCKSKSLVNLVLDGCKNLQRLPDELGNLKALEYLTILGTSIREVPSSILRLNNLQSLHLSGLRGHEKDDFISSFPSYLVGLFDLWLIDCDITELPESLGQLSFLIDLNLSENNFERLPESIINLSWLCKLRLYNCQRLQSLPKLPRSLEILFACNCTSLESISSFFVSSRSRFFFNFKYCYKLEGDKLRKIFEESLQKIQPTTNNCTLMICVPGSEIPKWFKNRSTESRITLKLQPTDHQKLIGFAFCLAFEEEHFECRRYRYLDYEFKVTNSNLDDLGLLHQGCVETEKYYVDSARFVDSDHIILGCYFFNGYFDFLRKFSDDNEFCIEFRVPNGCTLLKNFGIELLYA